MFKLLSNHLNVLKIAPLLLILSFDLMFAQYSPPSSPELYDTSSTEELQKVVSNKTGNYPGILLSFGQGRSADHSPKTAYSLAVDFSYRKAVSSWNLWEVGAELFFGQGGHAKAEMGIYLGALLKLGIGYTVSKGVNGVVSFGGGLAKASYSGTDNFGKTLKSSSDPLGSVFFVSYHFELIRPSSWTPFLGLRWSFLNFNLDKVSDESGTIVHNKKELYFHSPQVFIGIKI